MTGGGDSATSIAGAKGTAVGRRDGDVHWAGYSAHEFESDLKCRPHGRSRGIQAQVQHGVGKVQ